MMDRVNSPGRSLRSFPVFAMSILSAGILSAAPAPTAPIPLWPEGVPGEKGGIGEEKDTSKPGEGLVAGRPLIRLGNVTSPTIQVFRPTAEKDTGTAVIVFPGGGYHILALDLEGSEVCEWLNSIGVTGILLKYRVPKRPGQPDHQAALQDAQRAVGLVRQDAVAWGIRPDRIGVLGFSAGGNLAALVSNQNATRSYPVIDAADAVSCRPDFTVLIYPAYLTDKDNGDAVRPELPVTTNTPPTFISISQDDPVRVETALGYATGLQKSKVPFELHVYPTGGHGYGLRRTQNPVTTWPDRVADWMQASGWLREK